MRVWHTKNEDIVMNYLTQTVGSPWFYIPILMALLLMSLAVLAFKWGEFKEIKKNFEETKRNEEKTKHEDAERMRREAELLAKEKFSAEREKFEDEVRERRLEITRLEDKLSKKEDQIEDRMLELDKQEQLAAKKIDELIEKEDYLAEITKNQIAKLEQISGMSSEDAKKLLIEQWKQELQQEYYNMVKENELKIRENADTQAKEILSTTMQRYVMDQVVESTVSVVQLPSDEMKGRIIGREGRNIRTLETATGVDLIIDDTPEAVVLSCFDPIKREIAKLALEKLISDGRIHPVRIEEMVAKAKEEIENKIKSEGENAAIEMGIMNLNKELIRNLGKLYYRTSYGQNVLKHSMDVGFIAGMLAAEIGANVKLAKRAGLLHDIGKAVDQTQEGTHIQLGVELARKYGEKEDVIHAIEAHHGDVTANSIEAVLVKLADAVSAGRPGARRDTLEIYIKRLEQLEKIAKGYEGIKQTFAVQAGREIRVIVQPENFDDLASNKLARDIANKIEQEMDYPGQIKVTVVREFRTTEIAK